MRILLLRAPSAALSALLPLCALNAVACKGATVLPPSEALAASSEEYSHVPSVLVDLEMTTRSYGLSYTYTGTMGIEDEDFAYLEMLGTRDRGVGSSDTEWLVLPDEMYTRVVRQGWFVTRVETESALGLNHDLTDYERIIDRLGEVTRLDDQELNDREYARYGGDTNANWLDSFEDAGGSLDFKFWIDKKTDLPFKMTFHADLDIGGASMAVEGAMQFRYDEPVIAPEPPANARPITDQFPDTPCFGAGFPDCLEAQTELEAISSPTCEGEGRRICLAPVGPISPALVDDMVDFYKEQYGLEIGVLSPVALPQDLLDDTRQQVDFYDLIIYVSSAFADAFNDDDIVVIGITPVDIYNKEMPSWDYIFGNRYDYSYPRAAISSFRMSPEVWGEYPDRAVTTKRFETMLTKYIGLLYYGLPTSEDPASPLYDLIRSTDALDYMKGPLPLDTVTPVPVPTKSSRP